MPEPPDLAVRVFHLLLGLRSGWLLGGQAAAADGGSQMAVNS